MVVLSVYSIWADGLVSTLISFGGGEAYLTVAEGMFLSTDMVTSKQLYSQLLPVVNALPGSIPCKMLSGAVKEMRKAYRGRASSFHQCIYFIYGWKLDMINLTEKVGNIGGEANANMDIAHQLNTEVGKFKL